MDLNLDGELKELQDTARAFASAEFTTGHVRRAESSADGFAAEQWAEIVGRGWNWAARPGSVGGGHSLLGLCVIAEELGRVAASTPLVVTSGLSASLLKAVAPSPTVDRLLEELATPGTVVTAALVEDSGRDERTPPSLRLRTNSDGCTLTGTKVLVPYASVAEAILVTAAAPDGEPVIVAVDGRASGVTTSRHETTGGDPLFRVQFDGVALADDCVVARGDAATGALDAALDAAAVVAMAEAVGYCEGIIGLTVGHAKTREQFGQAIGSFQAVAHPLADMRIQADAVRLLTLEAAWLLDQHQPATLEVASAKAYANAVVAEIAIDGHRLHGAIGYSNEHDLQLFTRRARAFCLAYGGTDEQLERAASAMGL